MQRSHIVVLHCVLTNNHSLSVSHMFFSYNQTRAFSVYPLGLIIHTESSPIITACKIFVHMLSNNATISVFLFFFYSKHLVLGVTEFSTISYLINFWCLLLRDICISVQWSWIFKMCTIIFYFLMSGQLEPVELCNMWSHKNSPL